MTNSVEGGSVHANNEHQLPKQNNSIPSPERLLSRLQRIATTSPRLGPHRSTRQHFARSHKCFTRIFGVWIWNNEYPVCNRDSKLDEISTAVHPGAHQVPLRPTQPQ
eukprot:maker-scaffold301_size216225-snap-gene-0.17 protein:Tk06223 transcript:maker-scaffold301_size216225-snap-gene-0.17-mRNA-1 annotation:"atp-dependent rna helicase dhx30-like"